MDLGLTNAQKTSSLQGQKAGIQGEVYTLLVRMNIDPDDFDPTLPLEQNDSFVGELSRLSNLLQSLTLIESKLAELS
jgi:hypothetical protein